MTSYSEPDRYIREKVKVVLDLSCYGSKKKLEHATGVYTSDLAVKQSLLIWNLKLTR